MKRDPGIYVEILIQKDMDIIWRLTQEPQMHQRWDLRFSRIEYLPKASPDAPQHFLYETRIGFGISIRGTGESIGERSTPAGDTTSSLRFGSADPKSLIREGSGYWRYVPTPAGVRFFTWYDYEVRFGAAGRAVDHLAFRPLMGWATAWSFDRMRLWAVCDQSPESSITLSLIHGIARLSIAAVWIWHGLVPKLLYNNIDEQIMLRQAGVQTHLLPWIGGLEILFGIAVLATWRWRLAFIGNTLLMIAALFAVAIRSPAYLAAAFNPVTLNFAVIALSLIGWCSSQNLPSARRCLRRMPRGRK